MQHPYLVGNKGGDPQMESKFNKKKNKKRATNYFLSSADTIQIVHASSLPRDNITSGTSFPLIPLMWHNKVLMLQT